MRGNRDKSQASRAEKKRAHGNHIPGMAGGYPRIIGQHDITGLPGFQRKFRQHRAHRRSYRRAQGTDTFSRLRDRYACGIRQQNGEVSRLAHDGGKCSPHQNGCRFVHDRLQPRPQYGKRNGISDVQEGSISV